MSVRFGAVRTVVSIYIHTYLCFTIIIIINKSIGDPYICIYIRINALYVYKILTDQNLNSIIMIQLGKTSNIR